MFNEMKGSRYAMGNVNLIVYIGIKSGIHHIVALRHPHSYSHRYLEY